MLTRAPRDNPAPTGEALTGEARIRANWSRWLDRNEQETWQMELLVSGFAIVLLVQGFMPVGRHLVTLRSAMGTSSVGHGLVMGAQVLILFAIILTVFSLGLNVMLRALWIAGIGVRSVSGGIDFAELKLSRRFHSFLAGRLPDFDDYLLGLEHVCSTLFSLAFLTVFALLGIVVSGLVIGLPVSLLGNGVVHLGGYGRSVAYVVVAVSLMVGVITAVDTRSARGSSARRSSRASTSPCTGSSAG